MYLENLNNDTVDFSNMAAQVILDNLFISYVIIADVDLEKNFDNTCKSSNTQKPVEKIFKKIHDCVDF